MGKTEFLDALKRAMPGLPPALQAKTLGDYEQRFVDAVAHGRSEQDLARELDDPARIAQTLRASLQATAPIASAPVRKGAGGTLRLLLSAVGLGMFNLFMVAPAAVVGALLLCVYASALGFYVGGIAITASGLAGANELVLRAPMRAFGVDDASRTRIAISESGIKVGKERVPAVTMSSGAMDGSTGAGAADAADAADAAEGAEGPDNADAAEAMNAANAAKAANARDDAAATPRVVRGAEAVAGRGVHISTDLDDASRTTQTVLGMALVVAGIVLFLLALVASRYTLLGLRRYLQMQFALLRGH